jgi:chromosome segregation ATPase
MSIIRKIVGLLLIIAAVGGMLFSIIGLVTIWRVESNITTGIQNMVTLLNNTMATTAQGMVVTKESLRASVDTIGNLQTTMETVAQTINSTNPMVDDIAAMMEEELPSTIEATQQSLATAQESARVIDGLLGSLSNIPLIGAGIGYNPEVPLADALGQVGSSLEGLPESFASMEDNLRNTQSNLQTFEADMTVMAQSIGQIQSSVAQYEQVVDGYATSIDQIQQQLAAFSARIPSISRTLVWALTAFLVWMALMQLGLFTQGWELVTESAQRDLVEDIIEEIHDEEEKEPEVVVIKEVDNDHHDRDD